jgi:type IV pilus assembly protein PilE
MEQFFADNRIYPGSCVVAPTLAGGAQIQVPQLKSFNLTCGPMGNTTYVVTATGTGSMTGFTYTINESNVRTSAFSGTGASKGYTAASPNTCWVLRKGGVC